MVGIIGSINRSYLVDETLDLVSRILTKDPASHLLILSNQEAEYRARLTDRGLDPTRYTLARADHEAMPEWLSLIHWGMLILNASSAAKRASMPTKLAEFLASGVRPIQYGCNVEVSEWVRRSGSGVVLSDLSPTTLDSVAAQVVGQPLDAQAAQRAREIAHPHFSLQAGLERYVRVLERCFGPVAGGLNRGTHLRHQ